MAEGDKAIHILVVDDDPHLRQAAVRLLRREGYRDRCLEAGADHVFDKVLEFARFVELLEDLQRAGFDETQPADAPSQRIA